MDEVDQDALSPYAPIRWRKEVWWHFAQEAARQGLVRANGVITESLPHIIQQELVGRMMASLKGFIDENPEAKTMAAQALAKFLEQRHWVPLIGQYEHNGRQIFDLHDDLTEMLLATDVGDCTLEDLNLPYDCFFIRFGKQDDIKVPFDDDFEYVDGAFVAVTPWQDTPTSAPKKRFKIGLSTVKKSGEGVMMPGYFIDFTPEEACMPVDKAVDAAMARRRAAFFEGVKEGSMVSGLAEIRAAELAEGGLLARKALPLVFNAMFYLESLSDVPAEEPGRDTSSELTAKWQQSKPDRRHKVRSQLIAGGYAVVRLVGKEVARTGLGGSGVSHQVDGLKTHWRRGFFRQQPHGPERQLRRRQWIKPTVVNAHKSDASEAPGHIYVGDSNKPH